MAILDVNKLRVGKPVKEQFMGQDVYILPALNSAAMLDKFSELAGIDESDKDYSQQVAAVYVKHHVVDKAGKHLFDFSLQELLEEFAGKPVRELYDLVEKHTVAFGVEDAEKNS